MFRNKKAISPLVAVVMLIAFTLIVAGMLATFVTQMTQTQTRAAEICTGASAYLNRAVYDPVAGPGEMGNLTLTVYNTGKTNLRFKVLLSYSNITRHAGGITTHLITFPVDAGKIEVAELNNVTDDLVEVTIMSMQCDPPCYECPGAQDFIPYMNIKGLGY